MNREGYVKLLILLSFAHVGICLRKFYIEDECSGVIDMESASIPAGRLLVTRRSKYRNALACTVSIRTEMNKRIIIVFRRMEIEWEEKCDDDYVSFHDGTDVMAPLVQGTAVRLCGHKRPEGSFVSKGHVVTVFFQSDVHNQDSGFEIIFTAFHMSSTCAVDELRCTNGRCIARNLECNNFDNCGDNSDECHMDAEILLALLLSVFLLTIIAVGFITISKRKKRKQLTQRIVEMKEAVIKTHNLSHPSAVREIRPWGCSVKVINVDTGEKVHQFQPKLMAPGLKMTARTEMTGKHDTTPKSELTASTQMATGSETASRIENEPEGYENAGFMASEIAREERLGQSSCKIENGHRHSV